MSNKQLKNLITLIKVITVAAIIWLFVFRHIATTAAILLNILLPNIAVLLLVKYRGQVKFSSKKHEPNNKLNISNIVAFPAIALALYAIIQIDVINYTPIIIVAAILGTLVGGTAILFSGEPYAYQKIMGFLLTVPLIIITYGYGTATLLNAILNSTPPKTYTTKIVSKETVKGKLTDYKLYIAPCGPLTNEYALSVSKKYYAQQNQGNTITLTIHNGFFGSYYIAKSLTEKP